MINFNVPPDVAKEAKAILVVVCLAVAVLIAGGAAFLSCVPGPYQDVVCAGASYGDLQQIFIDGKPYRVCVINPVTISVVRR